MYPILCNFDTDISNYPQKVIGKLTKVKSAEVKEVLNGEYTLNIKLLPNDALADKAVPGRAIMVKPNYHDDLQIFVIRTMDYNNNEIEINAEHVKYMFFNNVVLASVDLQPLVYEGPVEAAVNDVLVNEVQLTNYFTFYSNISTTVKIDTGSGNKSVGDIFSNDVDGVNVKAKGEFHYDNFIINYNSHRGNTEPKNVVRYGTNLSSYSQELSDNHNYTHVTGFADVPVSPLYTGDLKNVRLYSNFNYPGSPDPQTNPWLYHLPNSGNYYKVLTLDFTEKFKDGGIVVVNPANGDNYGTARMNIAEFTYKYILDHPSLGTLSAKIIVDYEEVLNKFEKPALGDKVTVIYEPLNYKKNHRITEIVFDVISEKAKEITISESQRKLSLYDFIKNQNKGIKW